MKLNYLLIVVLACSLGVFSQNINDGVVGYWPLDCNTLDTTDNNLHGLIFDGSDPSCTTGKLNGGYYFDGENDYIEFPKERSNGLISLDGFTWSLWFQLDSLPPLNLPPEARNREFMTMMSVCGPETAEDIYIGLGSSTAKINELSFVVDGKGGFGGSASNNNALIRYKPENGFIKDSIYHICGIRDYENNKVELYFNGVKVDSAEYELEVTPLQNSFNAQIGRFNDGDGDIRGHFKGMLDEVRVYDRVLSEEEVLILFSARPEQLSVESNTLDFGNIKCENSGFEELEIYNEGPSIFIIDEFEFTNGEYFSLINSGSYTLVDQERPSWVVRFDPPSEGKFYDTLFVRNPFGVQPLIIYLEGEKQVDISISDEVDFGELVDCEEQQFLVQRVGINNGNIDEGLVPESVLINGAEILIDNEANIALGNGWLVSMTFSSQNSGTISETATITFDNCDLSYTFTAKANLTRYDPMLGSSDIPLSAIGETNQIEKQLINNGSTRFTIVDVNFEDGTEFSISDKTSLLGLTLNPSDTFTYLIDYLPLNKANTDKLIFEIESQCGINNEELNLTGNGTYKASFDLKIQDIRTNIGESHNLIAEVSNAQQLDISDVDTIYFDLEVNHTVANPTNRNLVRYTTNNPYNSIFKFAMIPEKVNDPREYNFGEFKFTLGNVSEPEFQISNISLTSGLADINTSENGKIILEDICKDGELTRLFYSDLWLELGQAKPNPTNDQFEMSFTTIEPGITKLYLINSSGEVVKEFINDHLDPGSYEGRYNISELKVGIYIYVLETPHHVLTNKLVKIK